MGQLSGGPILEQTAGESPWHGPPTRTSAPDPAGAEAPRAPTHRTTTPRGYDPLWGCSRERRGANPMHTEKNPIYTEKGTSDPGGRASSEMDDPAAVACDGAHAGRIILEDGGAGLAPVATPVTVVTGDRRSWSPAAGPKGPVAGPADRGGRRTPGSRLGRRERGSEDGGDEKPNGLVAANPGGGGRGQGHRPGRGPLYPQGLGVVGAV
jgi:hypothetical protein